MNYLSYTPSTLFNITSQIGPTIAGGYTGSISDIVQFVQTIGNSIIKQTTSSNQNNNNSLQQQSSKK